MDETPGTSQEPIEPTATGLHRSASKRMVAGVAGGVAERFDIDPNIVRVAFVVLSVLWGLGVAIYLAMWALIPMSPTTGGERNAKQVPVSSSRWPRYALLTGVVVVALIFVSSVGGVPHYGQGLASLWLVFLIVLAVVALRTPVRRLDLRRFVALLFLVALSIAILGSGIFLAVLESTGVPLRGGNGVRNWQPTSLSQVQHTYRNGFGDATLDLSHVTFPTAGFRVVASVSVGHLLVELPANAVVDLKTHVGVGSVDYPQINGWSYSTFTPVPSALTSATSQNSAPHLTLDAEVGFGLVDVVRAAVSPAG
jgi:phage shock protein PspC (stress-responsive transcriptional regulator)